MGSEASTTAVSAQAGDPAKEAFKVSDGYRNYVLWMLFLIYVFNFVDRQIVQILLEPIKKEFLLSDTQLGLLGGLAFAVLYCTLGIPIARLADTSNRPGIRVNIIAASLFVWSFFTVATGMAKSFTHLLLARIMVGVGEAGCSPPAYSLISDYFPPNKRATAMSVYSMGIYAGVFIGFLVGGQIAQHHGWRAAFYVVGLPGLLLAFVARLTLREPPRGMFDTGKVSAPPPSGQVMRTLWSKRSFRHLSLAAALHAFVGYGVNGFSSPFLMRSHGMSIGEVSFWLAMVSAFGGLTGTFLGGYLADSQTKKHGDMRWQLLVPGISTLLNVPFALAVYFIPNPYVVIATMVPSLAIGAMYLGPTIATTHGLVGVRERAIAGALLLFIINLIGLGMGPTLTGMLSDIFKAMQPAGTSELVATAEGLRYALCVMVLVNVWSALHYWIATRTLRQDLATAAAASAH